MDMPINRLNHAVLYVRDAERSAAFYREVLGFRPLSMAEGFKGAVFLQAPGSTNDHDLGLFSVGDNAGPSPAGRSSVGLYHLAWEGDTLDQLERLAGTRGWPACWPSGARWSVPATTAAPRASTPRTQTASSSRWPGSSRLTCSTTRPWPPASRSARSTSPGKRPATAPTPAAGSASPSPPDNRSFRIRPRYAGSNRENTSAAIDSGSWNGPKWPRWSYSMSQARGMASTMAGAKRAGLGP